MRPCDDKRSARAAGLRELADRVQGPGRAQATRGVLVLHQFAKRCGGVLRAAFLEEATCVAHEVIVLVQKKLREVVVGQL
jgi:hypothetical protein